MVLIGRMFPFTTLSIGLVVAILVTNASGSDFEGSSVYCVSYKDSPSWMSKQDDSYHTMESRVRNCHVLKHSGNQTDGFSTPISLQHNIFPGSSNGKEQLMYISITCNVRTRIYFTDYSENMNFSVNIGYLITEDCDIYWSDIEILGRVVDLRFIRLYNKAESFQSELELGYFTNATLPLGLRNIGVIRLLNKYRRSTEAILTDYEWPLMGLLKLVNYYLSSDIVQFRYSMPNLQQIVLNNCSITTPMTHFPWSDEFLKLPRSTARLVSDYINNLFSLTIPRHAYERIVNYEYNDISDLRYTVFTGRLYALFLGSNKIEKIGTNTLNQLEMVQVIDLSNNRIQFFPKEVFYNLIDIKYLYLDRNRLHQMDAGLFSNNPNMLLLSVADNAIKSIHQDAFQELGKLETLDLSHNQLGVLPKTSDIIQQLSKLRVVDISSNNVTIIPQLLFVLAQAHTIDISNNPITWKSFRQSLNLIDQSTFLSQNILLDGSCFKPDKQSKRIQLQRLDKFTTIRIDEMSVNEREMFVYLLKCYELDFDNSSLNCDCNVYRSHLFIQSHLSNYPYVASNFKCYKPDRFHTRPLASLEPSDLLCAQNITDCPEQCTCYFQPSANKIIVDCTDRNLTSLPLKVPKHTSELIASGNRIKELKYINQTYLTQLNLLDLSGNIISNMGPNFPSAVSSLQSLKLHENRLTILPKEVSEFQNTALTFRGNQWKCDCHAEWMKPWIISRRKFLNIDAMICATGEGRGDAIVDVPSELFVCEAIPSTTILKTSLITVSVLAVIFIVGTILLYKYRGEIKVLMYVHFKWHPFDRAPEADIVDKDYDVFISYSSKDFHLAKQVMEFLEAATPPYKVCLHDKDFIVGAPIQENIMDSVRTSRRMVMILTNNYLESDWCSFEFRAAHDRVLNDHTNYLILVLADDIADDKYDEDMKLYIRTNTYLELDNNWFYDKLKYALPEVPLCELETKSTTSDDSGVFYINDTEFLEMQF